MKKKQCVAMLLAGGQGTRLYALTSHATKPAVSFGAKYRIIDFPLSNCTNSGIDTVGVLTQYQPLILNEYIGTGEPWDLDRTFGGVHTLPPYQAKTGGEWYKGTANAIYQNLHFLKEYDSEHVLILSGDHIYTMDYSQMLTEHVENNADCTISVIDVDEKEASRFGIMDYDKNKRITSFEEKPKQPKSNHASMGIYIFKKDVLVSELIDDEKDPASSNDFGKNIIPTLLKKKMRVFAYQFKGYWKDVGTVTSLWEANMDLLGEKPVLTLNASGQKVYSRNEPLPPTFFGANASVENCMLTTGCEIYGKVKNSVIGEGVVIGEGAVVQDSVIMSNSVIGKGVCMRYGMVDENVTIGDNVTVGDEKSDSDHIALIGRDSVIAAGRKIAAGEIIDEGGNTK
ncbi:MAG: glucose-1-phosphate adenylyltransferase [Clostridia bacterium]|jgi:glucose-1-phosphate adenylyltransferase|nr:glucose-1-phosphate adenylyltransferase [Clostridia bacterium]